MSEIIISRKYPQTGPSGTSKTTNWLPFSTSLVPSLPLGQIAVPPWQVLPSPLPSTPLLGSDLQARLAEASRVLAGPGLGGKRSDQVPNSRALGGIRIVWALS